MIPMKINNYIIMLIMSVIFMISVRGIELSVPQIIEDQELKQDIDNIVSLGHLKRLGDLEIAADKIELKWRHRDKNSYAKIMLKVCETLNINDFENRKQEQRINVFDSTKQDKLIEKYATQALEQAERDKSRDFPFEQGIRFLVHLFYHDGVVHSSGEKKGNNWEKERREKAKLWIDYWHKLEKSIDLDWDAKDKPMHGVPLPIGSIDPKGLAKYKEDVARNDGRARTYNQQCKLRKLQTQFLPKAAEYLVSAYSQPPYNTEEIKRYLTEITDTINKERILTSIIGKMSGSHPGK